MPSLIIQHKKLSTSKHHARKATDRHMDGSQQCFMPFTPPRAKGIKITVHYNCTEVNSTRLRTVMYCCTMILLTHDSSNYTAFSLQLINQVINITNKQKRTLNVTVTGNS